ncbi:hypothetical protein V491_01243 [Pseudogymnoascus sp. VKM F-3775]|nr:hypothetical protein V491_01243 [Pseudogymnoascus sp. VKM F-3775]
MDKQRQNNKADDPAEQPPLTSLSPTTTRANSGRGGGGGTQLDLGRAAQRYKHSTPQPVHAPPPSPPANGVAGNPKRGQRPPSKLAWDGAEQEVTPAIV